MRLLGKASCWGAAGEGACLSRAASACAPMPQLLHNLQNSGSREQAAFELQVLTTLLLLPLGFNSVFGILRTILLSFHVPFENLLQPWIPQGWQRQLQDGQDLQSPQGTVNPRDHGLELLDGRVPSSTPAWHPPSCDAPLQKEE